jgi:vancomycin resistance protein YoaR
MKKFWVITGIVTLVPAATMAILAARYQPVIRPNTQVGLVPVGGLTKEAAMEKVRIWWESEKDRKLELTCKSFTTKLPPMTAGALGIVVDDLKSIEQCEISDFWDATKNTLSGTPEKVILPVVYKSVGANFDQLKQKIKDAIGPIKEATAVYVKGKVVTTKEVTSFTLDEAKLTNAVTDALGKDGTVEIPLTEAPKKVPDERLAEIKEVVSQYSTTFPSYQTNRNTNIRLAASKLNGHILLPGEKISFNKTVGQRTVKGGFREAPVLANGKHDKGIGGGICQVSTTMYNAVLLANLKIVQRQNHSVPSVYVPCGRDATVDWPDLDLVFQNNTDKAIAISSSYESGRLTFRILGSKVPGQSVKIVTSGFRSWSNGEVRIPDSSLPPGREHVIEGGSAGRSINVYRVVMLNGQEVKREFLGQSYYRGMKRQVAYSTQRAAPKPAPAAPASGGGEAPAPTPEPGL